MRLMYAKLAAITFLFYASVAAIAAPTATVTWTPVPLPNVHSYTIQYYRLDPAKSACWDTLQPYDNTVVYDAAEEARQDACESASRLTGSQEGVNWDDIPGATTSSFTTPELVIGAVYAFRMVSNKTDTNGDKDIGGRAWGPTVIATPTVDHPYIIISVKFNK